MRFHEKHCSASEQVEYFSKVASKVFIKGIKKIREKGKKDEETTSGNWGQWIIGYEKLYIGKIITLCKKIIYFFNIIDYFKK